MSDLRKILASAITGSDLSEDVNCETPLDRIGALAFANDLGGTLWRLKYANDHRSYDRALALLSNKIRQQNKWAGSITMARKICACVLDEWLDEICRQCGGREKIVVEGTPHARHACPSCSGTGMRQPSAQTRMSRLSLSATAYAKWEPRFSKVHQKIVEADDLAWASVASQLERITSRRSTGAKILAFRKTLGTFKGSDRPAHSNNNMPEKAVGSVAGA